MNRRGFLKLGALFVPVVAAPTVAYSFLWAKSPRDAWDELRPGTKFRIERQMVTRYLNGELYDVIEWPPPTPMQQVVIVL